MGKRDRQRKRKRRRGALGSIPLDFGRHKGTELRRVPRDYLHWYLSYGHDATWEWLIREFLKSGNAEPSAN